MNRPNHANTIVKRAAESAVQNAKRLAGITAVTGAVLLSPVAADGAVQTSPAKANSQPAPAHAQKNKRAIPEMKSLPQAAHELAVRLDRQQSARYWQGRAYITQSAVTGGTHYQSVRTGGADFPVADLPTETTIVIENPFLLKLHNPQAKSRSYNETAQMAIGSMHVNPETGKTEIKAYRLNANVILVADDGSGTFNPATQSETVSFVQGEAGLDPSRPQHNGGPLLNRHDQYAVIGRNMNDQLPY